MPTAHWGNADEGVTRVLPSSSSLFHPLSDPAGPQYIIKYILPSETIVEAHKGKLLICVPACRFCPCE